MACSQIQLRAGVDPCPRFENGSVRIFFGSMTAAYSSYSCGSTTMRYETPNEFSCMAVSGLSHLPFDTM